MTVALLSFCRPLRAFAVAVVSTMVACGGADAPTSARTASEVSGASGTSGAAGSSPVSLGENSAPPMLPAVQAAAGSSPPSMPAIADCAPGLYTGTYDIALFVTGPIMFNLVASASSMTVPCQEFCPDLVLNSDGGQFDASWVGFMGRAKLKGGLDCRTGEFRCEMVDGVFGFNSDPNDPNSPLVGGDLVGGFMGHYSGSTISGTIMYNVGFDMEGTFSVTRSP